MQVLKITPVRESHSVVWVMMENKRESLHGEWLHASWMINLHLNPSTPGLCPQCQCSKGGLTSGFNWKKTSMGINTWSTSLEWRMKCVQMPRHSAQAKEYRSKSQPFFAGINILVWVLVEFISDGATIETRSSLFWKTKGRIPVAPDVTVCFSFFGDISDF